jgi:hypothetical protein
MVAKVDAVPLLEDGTLSILGMTKTADSSAVNGSRVQRSITLTVSPAGEERFPTDAAKIYATKGLCKSELELKLAALVQADTPVVT